MADYFELGARLLAHTLFHFVWQGTVLWIVSLCVLQVAKDRGPRIGYLIYLGLLFLLTACPIATFVVAASDPARLGSSQGVGAIDRGDGVRMIAASLHFGAVDDLANRAVPGTVFAWIESHPWEIGAAWLAGAALNFFRLMGGGIGLGMIVRRRQPLPRHLAPMVDRLACALRYRTPPSVAVVERLSQAIAVGFFRPLVLLPASWVLELEPAVLEVVVAHELAHLKRWDLPVNLWQRAVETVLFFHPVVWWCSRRLRAQREMCCDDLALGAIENRGRYARALTFLAGRPSSLAENRLANAFGGDKMILRERIRNVLRIKPLSQSRFYGPSCALAGAVVASIVWIGIHESVRAQPVRSVVASNIDFDRSIPQAPSEPPRVSLPVYRIEPPDILLIGVVKGIPKRPDNTEPFGLRQVLDIGAAKSQIAGEHLVTPDGTVNLGTYGIVRVDGMTLAEAREAIAQVLRESFREVEVSVDVLSYNSKVYYVIVQGDGLGDQVLRIPITGNERLLDAVAQIGGFRTTSRSTMWIARPAAGGQSAEQILPVDWEAITKGGSVATNYQILPGDRVYVSQVACQSVPGAVRMVSVPRSTGAGEVESRVAIKLPGQVARLRHRLATRRAGTA